MEDMIPGLKCKGCFNWREKTEKHFAKCEAFNSISQEGGCLAYIDRGDAEKIQRLKTAINSYDKNKTKICY